MMVPMEEKDLAERLIREGYVHLYVWEDGPNVYHPEHEHRAESAHIILHGEMTLSMNGESRTYRTGDRCDLPAGIRHSAQIGPDGCRYLIGER